MGDSEGIARNIFNIIDAVYYKGKDAVISPNSDARGGEFSKVFGPNKVILDTGWSPMNAWVGLHQLSIRWYSDMGVGNNGLTVEYWKKDTSGTESVAMTVIVPWDTVNSDEAGNGLGTAYFTENHQYRIVVKSHSSVPQGNYVAVDYIKIIPVDLWAVGAPFYYALPSPDEGSFAISTFYSTIETVTASGTNWRHSKTVTITNTGNYLAVPVACILGNSYVIANIKSIASDYKSFELEIAHKDSVNWTGSLTAVVHVLFYPVVAPL